MVMLPAVVMSRPRGVPEPLETPAAFLISSEAGGVFRMKVKDLSVYTEISTGIMVPSLSAVRALYSLQKSMMLTPAEPRAGPIGGAGLALPALIASLMILVTALAIIAGSAPRTVAEAAAAWRKVGPAGAMTKPAAWEQQHTSRATTVRIGDLLASIATGCERELSILAAT